MAQKARAVATLAILKPNVSVRRKGKDAFKPATDGLKLRVGDTVQTDAAGFAQVNYTDQSLTRLDVSTTFTIVSLTDDEGNRQIKGKVDTGRTWNRTSALTESETFQQEGAGATAAVVGTAFMVECDANTPQQCTFTSVIDGIQLTSIDGEIQDMDPLQECDSTEVVTDVDADLCDVPEQLTIDAVIANQWILLNLYLDGLGGFEGIIVVEGGQVISFTATTVLGVSVTSDGTTTTLDDPPPPPPTPPVINDKEVNITSTGGDPAPGATTGPANTIVSEDERKDVTFTLQVTNPDGGDYWILFTVLPDPKFGRILTGSPGTFVAVNTVDEYDPATVYTFDPVQFEPACGGLPFFPTFAQCFTNGRAENQSAPDDPNQSGNTLFSTQPYPSTVVSNGDGTVSWTGSFSFVAENDEGLVAPEETVELEVVEDICSSEGGVEALRLRARLAIPECNPFN